MRNRAESAAPRLFCAVRRSKEFNLRPISSEAALEFALSCDTLARELNEYEQQVAIANLLWPRPGRGRRRLETLQRLLSRVACYELDVASGESLTRLVGEVRALLD